MNMVNITFNIYMKAILKWSNVCFIYGTRAIIINGLKNLIYSIKFKIYDCNNKFIIKNMVYKKSINTIIEFM